MAQKSNPTSTVSEQTSKEAKENRGKDRRFISDEGFRNAIHNGKQGFKLKVRLTSYRSLPLSCIEGMHLIIDGQSIESKDITFILNGYSHGLDEFSHLSHIWWFILDYAELFIARENGLSVGEHEVEGTLITVEPYITAGRFSFFSSAKKRLLLDSEI